jgi:hypothetical protein
LPIEIFLGVDIAWRVFNPPCFSRILPNPQVTSAAIGAPSFPLRTWRVGRWAKIVLNNSLHRRTPAAETSDADRAMFDVDGFKRDVRAGKIGAFSLAERMASVSLLCLASMH